MTFIIIGGAFIVIVFIYLFGRFGGNWPEGGVA